MRYLEILFYGVYTDLQTEISRKLLGFLWWIIEPVLYMATFYLVFGIAMNKGEPGYVNFLLTGMVAWKWFDGSVRLASTAITNNSSLIQQVHIPKFILILIPVFSNTFKFAIVLTILLLFLAMQTNQNGWNLLHLSGVILTQLFFITSVSTFLGAIVPFASDLKQVIDNLFMLLMFVSGVFFSVDDISGVAATIFDYNPVFLTLSAYRDVLLHHTPPNWENLGYTIIFALPMLSLGLLITTKFERHYSKLTT
jgi:lipopolysaccharide transport system permease protein